MRWVMPSCTAVLAAFGQSALLGLGGPTSLCAKETPADNLRRKQGWGDNNIEQHLG